MELASYQCSQSAIALGDGNMDDTRQHANAMGAFTKHYDQLILLWSRQNPIREPRPRNVMTLHLDKVSVRWQRTAADIAYARPQRDPAALFPPAIDSVGLVRMR
jgi:hypothetical protein